MNILNYSLEFRQFAHGLLEMWDKTFSRRHFSLNLIPLLALLVFLSPALMDAQYTTTICQQTSAATLGPDRNDFVHQPGQWINEGYLHNFPPPTLPCGIVSPSLTSVVVAINLISINQTVACSDIPIFGNVITEQNCTLAPVDVCGIVQEVLTLGCGNFGAGTTISNIYTLDIVGCGNAIAFDDVIGVDIVPSTSSVGDCTNSNTAITDGDIAVDYEICITYVYDQDESLPVAVPDHSDVCPGDGPIELTGSTTFTGTNFDYSWTGPNGFTANGPSVFTNDPADEGTYTLIVDVDGCISDPVDVQVEYLTFAPQVNAVNSNVCFGENIELAVTGGGTTFSWFDPSGTPVGGNTSTLTTPAGGTGGTQTYTVTVSDGTCTVTLPINIAVSSEITGEIIVNPTGGVCAGEPTMFTVRMTDGSPFPAGWTFDWNGGDGSGPTYSFTENTPGNYTMNVTVTDPNLCSVVLSEGFDVTATGGNTGQINNNTPLGIVCAGDPVEFTAVMGDGSPFPAGWTFDWNNGDGSGPTYQVTENTPNNYTVEVRVTNPTNCSFILSESYTVAEVPLISITPANPTICFDGSVVLTANASGGTGTYDYIWLSDVTETNSTFTVDINSPVTQGIFVDITDGNGCMAFSSTVDVEFLPDLPAVTFGACSSGSETEVTFNWNDVGQTVFELYLTVDGGTEQIISTSYTNLSYTATGLTAGANAILRIVPVVTGNGVSCFGPPQSLTCTTDNASCDNPGWLFTAIDPVCLTTDGQAFNLSINTSTAGTIVLNSTDLGLTNQPNGPGGVTTVSLPALPGTTSSGTYTVMASFTLPDGSCPFDTTFNIPVATPANPEISTPLSNICSAQENVRFTLVNAYDPNSTYTITVDNPSGSFIILEDAPNQVFDISFSEYRTYQVTLTTTTTGDNTCSDSFTLPFTLTEPPARPVLSCAETGLDSVAFSWSDVGADGYTVDQIMIPGTGVVEETNNGFIVRGLVAGESVTIAVTASTPGCPSAISDTITCVAQSCPPVVPQITTPVDTFCSDGSEMLVELTVNVPASGTVAWTGPGVTGTQFDPGAAGAGEHEITVEYTEGDCDYTASFQLVVVDPPSGSIEIAGDTICQNEMTTVSFTGINLTMAAFEWIFPAGATVLSGDVNGPGPLEVSFSGLDDQVAQLVLTGPFCEMDTLRDTVFVATSTLAVSLECANVGLDQVGFSWMHPTATTFTVNVIDQPAGATISQTNNSLLATGLLEGESVTIEVTALSDNACPDGPPVSLTCTAVSCPGISFSIGPLGPFCVGDDVDVPLTIAIFDSDGSGVLTIADSTFITGNNFTSVGLLPGLYTVSAVFEEGGCSFPASIDIEITDLPDASFTLTAGEVCVGEVVGADAGAEMVGWSYEFTSDGSATVVETSPTTVEISWPTPGTKEIVLVVRDVNGCENRSTETIEVVAPLSAPLIGCGTPSFTSVEFNWNTEVGVDSFRVTIDGGTPFFQDSTNLFLGGLSAGQRVNIEVIAFGSGACGNSPVGMENCETDSCPTITVLPPGNQTFCLGAMGNEVILTATQMGASGMGAFTFSGPGVTENAGVYTFDADAAGPGMHTLTARYDESVCSGMVTFVYTVNTTPTSDFTLNGQSTDLTVCEGETFVLTYTGNLTQADNGVFDWDFAPASRGADLGFESYELSYANAGDYVISLSVEANGCESETTQLNVRVDPPLSTPSISCGTSSFNSVVFNWNTETGVDSFQVTINGGTPFFQDSTDLMVGGLNEGEIVSLQVVAFGSGGCGNSPVGMGSCQAESCPAITVTPPGNQTFCLGAMGNEVILTATQMGASGMGAFTFSGPGVTENAGVYTFNADAAGPGMHTLTVRYDESICSGMATFEYTVNTVPTSDFTLDGQATDLTVCEGETFVLTYTGNLTQADNGVFDWDFTPASRDMDLGFESFELSYTNAGDYVISLSVEADGCQSETTQLNVRVGAPLSTPVISCGTSSFNSVVFNWNAETGVDSFQVAINGGAPFFQDSTDLMVGGLNEGEIVNLQVVAFGSGGCGNSPVGMGSCQAESCPVITVTPPGNETFCLGAVGNEVILAATQMGASGMGAFTFSGPGVTVNAGVYTFDADFAGPGMHILTARYDESVCSGTVTFVYTVNTTPTSDFTLNGQSTDLTVCEGENFTLTYTGNLTQADNGVFDRDFAPANRGADLGFESYELSYTNAGDYTISLSVELNDCESEVTQLNVRVEAPLSPPVVSCIDVTSSSVTFGWAAVPGAVGYQLSDGTTLNANELSYTVSGLLPVESTNLSVVALSSSTCGNSLSSVVASCTTTEDCSTGETFTEPCDDGDPFTINDRTVFLRQDSSICLPCAGVPCDFSIGLDPDITISIGDSLTLRLVTNAAVDSVLWEDVAGLSCLDCLEPVARPTQTTTYSITAFDENGCEANDEITIVVDERRSVFIPNAFSPNDDGVNDFFEVQGGADILMINSLSIFDRWGANIFSVTNQSINAMEARWDGTYRGQTVGVGVYVYSAEIEFFDGHIETISGQVLILK